MNVPLDRKTIQHAATIIGIVTVFYLPAFYLLPDDGKEWFPPRWIVWMLGYLCGCAVMIFTRRLWLRP